MKRSKGKEKAHEPVMVREVIKYLNLDAPLKKQARIIDATVGTGGHALAIVKAKAEVLGIEVDKEMLEIAEKRLQEACPTPHQDDGRLFKLVLGNFRNIDRIAKDSDFSEVDGIVFDLGVSNVHFTSSRGFSFADKEAPLDMRLDPQRQGVTAADLLNSLPKDKLQKLFEAVMSKNEASKIKRAVLLARDSKSIKTVGDALKVIGRKRNRKKKLHPATLPFLALRIAVNSELENLQEALPQAFRLLNKRGRLVVISFHSGEDAIVKDFFKGEQRLGKAEILTKRPILPSEEEVRRNPSARSAKLRTLEKK